MRFVHFMHNSFLSRERTRINVDFVWFSRKVMAERKSRPSFAGTTVASVSQRRPNAAMNVSAPEFSRFAPVSAALPPAVLSEF
jgi:hypothetical protein